MNTVLRAGNADHRLMSAPVTRSDFIEEISLDRKNLRGETCTGGIGDSAKRQKKLKAGLSREHRSNRSGFNPPPPNRPAVR